MAQWMTGVVLVDQLAVELFMGAMQTMGNPAGMDGVAMVLMAIEMNAAIQSETETAKTGSVIGWPGTQSGSGGAGDIYPT